MVYCSSHQFGRYGHYPSPTGNSHATRREPGEVAMMCSTLEVCQAQNRQYAKIKMQIVLAVGLGCEPLIYTGCVKLCNKHEDNAWDAPYWTASTNIPSLSTTLDKTSTVTVFALSLLFKTGVDC